MNRGDELTPMRGEVSTAGIARSVMRIAWQVLRWPLFAFLVIFEPIVGPVPTGAEKLIELME